MKYIVILNILLFGLFSCQNNTQKLEKEKTVVQNEKLVEHAIFFQLTRTENGFWLTIINPKDESVELEIELSNNPTSEKSINTKENKFAVLSQASVGMLARIGNINRISAISGKQYLFNQMLKKRVEEGKISEITDAQNTPVENILLTNSDIILYSGFGNKFPKEDKLKEFDILCLPLYDWKETDPLGKAEWIKLMGALTGEFEIATEYFTKVEAEYNRLKKIALQAKTKPKVLSGNKFNDIWYAPAGNSFNAKILADAQINYIFKDTKGTGSTEKTFEQIIAEASDCDFWFNPGMPTSKQLLESNPKLEFINAFPNETYCYSQNTNKFWELSAMNPDRVLHDLIVITHPDLIDSEKLFFYQKIQN